MYAVIPIALLLLFSMVVLTILRCRSGYSPNAELLAEIYASLVDHHDETDENEQVPPMGWLLPH